MLNLVIQNEKSDLESEYSNSLESVFNNVVELKRIENLTLERLTNQPIEHILADDQLIDQLRDSRQTAEKISSNLRMTKAST